MGVLTAQSVAQGGEPNPLMMLIPQAVTWLVQLVFLLPNWAVSCRRLHDTGHSGWWLVAPLAIVPVMVASIAGIGIVAESADEMVPVMLTCIGLAVACLIASLVFGILLLVWFCSPTQPGPNRYGPQPEPF